MELKKDINKLLDQLKVLGWGRAEIESEFGYSDNYISQALSRGGNDKLLVNLKKLHERVLREAKPAPGDRMNPVRAFMLAVADDYATWRVEKEMPSAGDEVKLAEIKKIKKDIARKAKLILGGLDEWPFEDLQD